MIDQFGDQEAGAASYSACRPGLPASLVPGAGAVEKEPSRQLTMGENSERSGSNTCISPAPPTIQDSPERVQGNQCLLQIPGDVDLPPLKSSRGDNISCWQNTATQRPKAQRGSNIIPSRTLRIQPLFFFFCPKYVDWFC